MVDDDPSVTGIVADGGGLGRLVGADGGHGIKKGDFKELSELGWFVVELVKLRLEELVVKFEAFPPTLLYPFLLCL